MGIAFDIDELNKVLKDFYIALKIRNSIFDVEYNEIACYPPNLPKYCARIREGKAGRAGCAECDRAACIRARELGHVHVYTCHAGLLEAITPIMVDGECMGYALLSHISSNENTESTIENAHRLNKKYGLTKEETAKLIGELQTVTTPMSRERINSVAHILEALVSYVCTKQLVKKSYDVMTSELEKYIDAHLADALDCDSICKHFNISRSYLFSVSKKHFGTGISEYIKKKRIRLACNMLSKGKITADVAECCGFSDTSYFFKVFKSATGMTPREYVGKRK